MKIINKMIKSIVCIFLITIFLQIITINGAYFAPIYVVDDIEYRVENDTENTREVSVSGYVGTSDEIVIPSHITYEGKTYTVKYIASYAFANETSFKKITIPKTIVNITEYAFYKCTSLESITIPNTITAIRTSAFEGCTNLKEVILEEKGETLTIGEYAFKGCTSLKEIVIPLSVEIIKKGAFYNCYELTIYCKQYAQPEKWSEDWNLDNRPVEWNYCKHIYVNSFNEYKHYEECTSCGNIINKKEHTYKDEDSVDCQECDYVIPRLSFVLSNYGDGYLVNGIGTYKDSCVEIPSTYKGLPVDGITTNAFSGNININEVVLPNTIKSIGWHAFSDCTNLKKITIPTSVIRIDSNAFENCTSLNVYYDGTVNNWINISFSSSNIFADIDTLYVRNENMEYKKLETIYLTSNEINIKYYVFSGMQEIKNIKISKNVSSIKIESNAFNNCDNIKNVYYEGTLEDWLKIKIYDEFSNPMIYAENFYYLDDNNNYQLLENIIIPETITEINDYQFYGFSNVYGLTLHDNITKIGYFSFYSCERLKFIQNFSNVNVKGVSNAKLVNEKTLFEIIEKDDYVFVHFGDEFYLVNYKGNNSSLELPININGQSYDISKNALTNNKIQSVIIPDGVKKIDHGAFSGCTSLKSIEIPNSVTSIGVWAFSGCTMLQNVTFPNKLENIEWSIFNNCEQLLNVYFSGTIEDWCKYYFSDNTSNPMYYAKHFYILNNEDKYEKVTSIKIPEGITKINPMQFYGFQDVTTIEIPSSVRRISNESFIKCTNLKEFIVDQDNEYFESIDGNLYDNTTLIAYAAGKLDENYVMPLHISEIEDYAFEYCTYLKNITLSPQMNETINGSYFENIYVNENSPYLTSIDGVLFTKDGKTLVSYPSAREGTKYVVPDGTKEISWLAFRLGNKNLEITIPKSVVEIDFNSITQEDYHTITINAYKNSSAYEMYNNRRYYKVNLIEDCDLEVVGLEVLRGPIKNTFLPNEYISLKGMLVAKKYSDGTYAVTSDYIINYNIDGTGEQIVTISSSDNKFTTEYKIYISTDNTIAGTIDNNFNYKFNIENKELWLEGFGDLSTIPWEDYKEDLSKVYYKGSIEDWCNITFNSYYDNPMNYAKEFYITDEEGNYYMPTEIIIPEGVVAIKNNQFIGFSSIVKVKIADSVKIIGEGAFSKCDSIEEVEIGENSMLSIMAGNAFSSCNNLTKIYIPYMLNDIIGGFSFDGKEIVVSSENDAYKSIDGNLYSKDGTRLIKFAPENETEIYVVSNDITSIDDYAFYGCKNLKEVIFEEGSSLTTINKGMFSNCKALISIEIPSSITKIKEYAFNGCENLTNIYYQGTIENWCNIEINLDNNPMILAEQFFMLDGNNEYYELTKLIIPNTITSIGKFQFYGFENITSVEIPSSVKYIGYEAFTCEKLTTVYYQGTIKDWCDIEFEYLSANPMNNAIHFYILDSNNQYSEVTELVIPEGVNKIGDYQFYGFNNLNSVSIPKTVEVIGKGSFGELKQLKEIKLEEENLAYKMIDNDLYTIDGKVLIKYVEDGEKTFKIPDGVTKIDSYAFESSRYSNKLKYVMVPNSVEDLTGLSGKTLFVHNDFALLDDLLYRYKYEIIEDIQKLEIESLPYETEFIKADDVNFYGLQIKMIYNDSSYKLVNDYDIIYDPAIDGEQDVIVKMFDFEVTFKITISSTIKFSCGEQANAVLNINTGELVISGVGSINDDGKEELSKYSQYIKTIVIEEGITEIMSNCFGWLDIETLTLPSTITKMDYNYLTTEKLNYNSQISDWMKIDFVSENSNFISYNTVFYCLTDENELKELKSLSIPDGVTTIPNYVFEDYSGLISVSIPDTVSTIGEYAFSSCDNLKELKISEDSKLVSFKEGAFMSTSLEKVYIPKMVIELPLSAFYECVYLSEYDVSEDNEVYKDIDGALYTKDGKTLISYPPQSKTEIVQLPEGLEKIDMLCFALNSSIKKITIPNTVKEIEYGAFGLCTALEEVSFEGVSQVTEIKEQTFYYCEKLETITIPSSVTKIGEYAFGECINLKNVYFAENSQLTTIGYGAFEECKSIENINLPVLVEEIGEGVFYGCESLKNINIVANNVNYSSENGVLYNNDGTTLILYPAGKSSSTYCIPEGVKVIGEGSFMGSETLKEIIIPSSVTDINRSSFSRCENLEKVQFLNESELTTIGDYAFSYCKNLIEINIPNSVETIGEEVFYNCKGLTSIRIPESLVNIGYGIFMNCDSLYVVYNDSNMDITDVLMDSNVKIVYDKEGNASYIYGIEYSIVEQDGFKFIYNESDGYVLYAYIGTKDKVTLPDNINNEMYRINMKYSSASSIVLPNTIETLYEGSFDWCESVKELIIPSTVKVIENFAVNGMENMIIYCEPENYLEGWSQYSFIGEIDIVWNYNSTNLGDLNNDMIIDTNDVIYLLYYVMFGESMYPVNQSVDYDQDNNVTTNDVVYLLYHVMFEEAYPLS
ncbi:MAG: leucine-rich repeat protein [Bacilli bacterium]|nr:leucine-rich repeat protein [Bacilli bacterium]